MTAQLAIAEAISLLAWYYAGKLFLRITDDAVTLEDRLLGQFAYSFRWSEVGRVLALRQRTSIVQFVFFVGQGRRRLFPQFWSLASTTLPIKDAPVTQFTLTPVRNDSALVQIVRHYCPALEEVDRLDPKDLKDPSRDLGKAAMTFTMGALALAGVAVGALLWNTAKPISDLELWMATLPLGLLAFIAASGMIDSRTPMIARNLVGLLFASCLCWATVNSVHLYTTSYGDPQVTAYTLLESETEYQRWGAADGQSPDIGLHGDPGNFLKTTLGETHNFKLIRGPLGVVDVPRSELLAIYKKQQRGGLRRN
ncbi:MAG: hypothetical protein HY255_08555 [Betaproteobacteria bacterium]|nr:hypothetical protein [Betaproteobacteria bacterium]